MHKLVQNQLIFWVIVPNGIWKLPKKVKISENKRWTNVCHNFLEKNDSFFFHQFSFHRVYDVVTEQRELKSWLGLMSLSNSFLSCCIFLRSTPSCVFRPENMILTVLCTPLHHVLTSSVCVLLLKNLRLLSTPVAQTWLPNVSSSAHDLLLFHWSL